MSSHTYHTTPAGHEVKLTISGTSGPTLISFHGGGILNGSRRDVHVPPQVTDKWPGIWIAADYRLLLPSSGQSILEDLQALFSYLPNLPQINPHQLFISGYSGGGYPMRLAAMLAAEESQKPTPAYTVLGIVSYFGMAGDLFLDYWLSPRGTSHAPLDMGKLKEEQERLSGLVERFRSGEEYSDCPYTEGLEGHFPARGPIWDYWHATGSINDSIAGHSGLSATLAKLPYEEREEAVPKELRYLFPQIYIKENAEKIAPTLLIHGDEDEAVPFEESLKAKRDLEAGGARVEMRVIKGGNHNLEVGGKFPQETLDAYAYTVEWMLKLAEESKGK